MAPVFPIWDYENLARTDLASQELLALLWELDQAAAAEWTEKIDAIWEKYADIASLLAEHERYDCEALRLLEELDREIGVPLLEEVRLGLPAVVAGKLNKLERARYTVQADINSFLLGVGKEELVRRRILRKGDGLIDQTSIPVLIDLMKERGVDRLVCEGPWFLDADGSRFNPKNSRLLFDNQNEWLNPFFVSKPKR